MDAETLKKKIDGLMIGLRSTNPGDINAIKDILNALAEGAGGGGAPVIIETSSINDYTFLEQLRQRINDGKLFDTIITIEESDGPDLPGTTKYQYAPLSFNEACSGGSVCILRNTYNGIDPDYIVVPNYTHAQFEAIKVIQEALELEDHQVYLITLPFDDTPGAESKYLAEDDGGRFICVDGYILEVGLTTGSESYCPDGKIIASITKKDFHPEGEFINITMEDAQKLIGIPINRL